MTTTKRKINTTFEADPQLIAAIDEIVSRLGLSRSWFIRAAIREYLKGYELASISPIFTPEPVITVQAGK